MVPQPDPRLTYDTCKTTFHAVNKERKFYTKCAKAQLKRCNADLAKAITEESNRVTPLQEENSRRVTAAQVSVYIGVNINKIIPAGWHLTIGLLMQAIYTDCSGAMTTTKASISKWLGLSDKNAVPYCYRTDHNGTCTFQQFSQAKTILGDDGSSASRSEVLTQMATYSSSSQGTIDSIIGYLVELNAYNFAYIK